MPARFGLVTAYARFDWHARRLRAALSAHGLVEVVAPESLRVVCGESDGGPIVRTLAGRTDVRRFSAVVLGRVVSEGGEADLELDGARAIELCDVPCVNRVQPMLDAQDKLWTAALLAKAGVPTPLCSSLPRPDDSRDALADVASNGGRAVLKPLFGSLGEGMARLDRNAPSRLQRLVSGGGPQLVQRYVETGGADLRLFVVGDRVEACVRRECAPGEWRTNAARQGRSVEVAPKRVWRDVCIAATRAVGLAFGGVDLALEGARPLVLEVNGFPSFRAVHRATGRDMALPIAALAAAQARRLAARRRGRGRVVG
jgi:RimK family alpha-L-glutamate ligase